MKNSAIATKLSNGKFEITVTYNGDTVILMKATASLKAYVNIRKSAYSGKIGMTYNNTITNGTKHAEALIALPVELAGKKDKSLDEKWNTDFADVTPLHKSASLIGSKLLA